jgi:hypothetical protein
LYTADSQIQPELITGNVWASEDMFRRVQKSLKRVSIRSIRRKRAG